VGSRAAEFPEVLHLYFNIDYCSKCYLLSHVTPHQISQACLVRQSKVDASAYSLRILDAYDTFLNFMESSPIHSISAYCGRSECVVCRSIRFYTWHSSRIATFATNCLAARSTLTTRPASLPAHDDSKHGQYSVAVGF